jgi:hypothetical protein
MFLYRIIPDGGKHSRLCCKKNREKFCAEAHRSAGKTVFQNLITDIIKSNPWVCVDYILNGQPLMVV